MFSLLEIYFPPGSPCLRCHMILFTDPDLGHSDQPLRDVLSHFRWSLPIELHPFVGSNNSNLCKRVSIARSGVSMS